MTKGARIKALRDNFGLTQDELAEKIGTTKQTIYKYETGIITNIPSDKIETMASLFDVSPSYLMGWNDAGAPSSDSSLTDGEQQIVSSFRQLNEEGRERLLNYADDLVASGRYIKTNEDALVEGA